jgi:hypothetical protein
MFYGDVYDVTDLEYPKSESFIKYDDLTEETIVSWIKNNIDYDELVLKASQILEENKNPSVLEKDPPFIKEEKYTGEEEYLIVIDGDVEKIWGPMKWHSGRANNGLKHYGILDYTFPYDITMYQKELLPIDSPFVVSDRVTVYKVEYTERPKTYDELLEYPDKLTWVLDSGKAVGTYFIHQRTIEEVKELLIEKALEKFNKMHSENLIDVELNGKIYPVGSDYTTIYFLFLSRLELNNRETAIIKLPVSGDYVEFNNENLEKLSDVVYNHRNSILLQEKQAVEAIKAASTIEELKEIEV